MDLSDLVKLVATIDMSEATTGTAKAVALRQIWGAMRDIAQDLNLNLSKKDERQIAFKVATEMLNGLN